jgi:hypothetical protein
MDYQRFYAQLFQPIEERIGRIDDKTLMAIIGFDGGGPVSLCTVGQGLEQFVTYVTCELCVRKAQKPAGCGRYELMMTCDDQDWARKILSNIGHMSIEAAFDHGHTVDIGQIVGPDCPLQGLVVERFARVKIRCRGYGLLRLHGVTRSELEFAMEEGADALLERLQHAGVYPRTSIHRRLSIGLAD